MLGLAFRVAGRSSSQDSSYLHSLSEPQTCAAQPAVSSHEECHVARRRNLSTDLRCKDRLALGSYRSFLHPQCLKFGHGSQDQTLLDSMPCLVYSHVYSCSGTPVVSFILRRKCLTELLRHPAHRVGPVSLYVNIMQEQLQGYSGSNFDYCVGLLISL